MQEGKYRGAVATSDGGTARATDSSQYTDGIAGGGFLGRVGSGRP